MDKSELKDIVVEYSNEATVNTGNYQNVKPGYRVSVKIPDGSNPNDARLKLKGLVDSWIEQDVIAYQAEMNS